MRVFVCFENMIWLVFSFGIFNFGFFGDILVRKSQVSFVGELPCTMKVVRVFFLFLFLGGDLIWWYTEFRLCLLVNVVKTFFLKKMIL